MVWCGVVWCGGVGVLGCGVVAWRGVRCSAVRYKYGRDRVRIELW